MEPTDRFSVFSRPHATGIPLAVPPQLESWDAVGSPSQARLATFLAHMDEVAASRLSSLADALALELVVGLDEDVSLVSGGRDLDNYVYPVVRHLGWQRFVSVHGRKHHGASSISVAPAMSISCPSEGWRHARAVTTSSTAARAWKEEVDTQVRQQCGATAPDAPLELQLSFRLSAQRNWAYLWKPAIDALGSILGDDPGGRPFHPRDDRIVSFAAHREVVPGIGNSVEIGIWWRPAPLSRPQSPVSTRNT